jgi:hypothetical protein
MNSRKTINSLDFLEQFESVGEYLESSAGYVLQQSKILAAIPTSVERKIQQ